MDAAIGRVTNNGEIGITAGTKRAALLLADYAWSPNTVRSRNAQWQAWVSFCTSENRMLLPATEAHFIAFIGWVASEREAGRRSVSAASLPQYLSAVRQMHLAVIGEAVPSFPMVWHVIRGFRKWEEANFPQRTVRAGVPASIVQRIWALGMETSSLSLLRDAAIVLFAYLLNGLRESSVASLKTSNIILTESNIVARLSVVKGQQASGVPVVAYARLGSLHSPLDLWKRWAGARGAHVRYFALQGESQEWSTGLLTRALKNCLSALSISDPLFAKYTSHSLMIGAHTEQFLLGFPLEVRLPRLGGALGVRRWHLLISTAQFGPLRHRSG